MQTLRRVLVRFSYQNLVKEINSRGARSRGVREQLRQLAFWATEHGVEVRAELVGGGLEPPSRPYSDSWATLSEIVAKRSVAGDFDVDLFAVPWVVVRMGDRGAVRPPWSSRVRQSSRGCSRWTRWRRGASGETHLGD